MAVYPALRYSYKTKNPLEHLISVYFTLLLFIASSLFVFNAYAQQQGGAATGGSATSGSTVGGSANCFGTCIFNGPPANGGQATGGNAGGSGDGDSGGRINSSNHTVLSQTLNNPPIVSTTSTKNPFVKKWGSIGTGNGQFNRPIGIAIGSSNENVYVLDSGNNRIQKFDSDGKFITAWGTQGTADGQFKNPTAITFDSTGNIYVLDSGNNRIQKFDSEGNSLNSWPINGTSGFSSSSSNNNRVNIIPGIAVDFSGNVYQSASASNKIFKYTTDGSFINSWGSNGKESGQFSSPTGIAVYQSGNYVYVIDHNNFRIQKFDSDGKFITTWGSQGSADGQFKNPTAIAIDPVGNAYVGDSGNLNIQKFDTDGKFLTKWSTKSSLESSQSSSINPTDIAIDTKSGNLYIVDAANNQVEVLNQSVIT